MRIGFSARNESSYGAIPHFQNLLMAGMMEAGGIPVPCWKVEDTIGLDAFVLVNSVPLAIQQQIMNNVGRYWTYLLDAPFHHANWISSSSSSTTYAMIDSSHVDILFQLDRHGVFLPHGGDTHAFRPWKDRDIDVLFTGTAPDLPYVSQHIETFSLETRKIVQQLIQEALWSPGIPLLVLLISILKQSGKNMGIEESMSVMTWSDLMVRATQRHNLLQAFSEFSVVVAGKGWDQVNMSPKHRWIGEVPYSKIATLMSRAKIVLCPSCGFTHGAHERILTAMGSGAVPLTMSTSFLSQHFEHGTHLAYFHQLQEAVDLGRLILNGSHWEVVGEAGHQIVNEGHTWAQRGIELFASLQGSMDRKGAVPVSPPSDLVSSTS